MSSFNKFTNHIISNFGAKSNINVDRVLFSNILKAPISISNIDLESKTYHETQKANDVMLLVSSATFTKCNGYTGGGIDANGTSLIIRNSIFDENKAEVGGAISALFCSKITLDGNRFSSNTAQYTGALNLDSNVEKGDSNVRNSNLTGNTCLLYTSPSPRD